MRLSEAVANAEPEEDVTDAGYWEFTVTDTDDKTTKIYGSLIYSDSKAIQEFCRVTRKALKTLDLFLLDGYDREN